MTSLSIIECCQLLAIDPKTLRQWLSQAKMALHAHPSAARVKCLTSEQVHLLANLHGRRLQLPAASASREPDKAQSLQPPSTLADLQLGERLAQLEAQVTTLQAQLTEVALQLLQERQLRTEQRLLALETQFTSTGQQVLAGRSDSVSSLLGPQEPLAMACHPTEQQAPLIPLIEYGARGNYVLICPKQGELHITAESAAWFEWLASLSSFRFVGQSGRFSARRGYNRRPHRGWYAQRTIHQKNYSKYIGVSEHLTIARLEQVAAELQSYLTVP
jgi:hypothetical protein